jgi:hypothetical protein
MDKFIARLISNAAESGWSPQILRLLAEEGAKLAALNEQRLGPAGPFSPVHREHLDPFVILALTQLFDDATEGKAPRRNRAIERRGGYQLLLKEFAQPLASQKMRHPKTIRASPCWGA